MMAAVASAAAALTFSVVALVAVSSREVGSTAELLFSAKVTDTWEFFSAEMTGASGSLRSWA